MTSIAHIDAETTGLDELTAGHEIWEWAVVLDDPAVGETREYVWEFAPDLSKADPVAMEKNRYHIRHRLPDGWEAARIGTPLCGLTRHEAILDVQDMLRDAWWVGANPGFDQRFLRALFHAAGPDLTYRETWRYRPTDVESLAQQAMGWPTPRGLAESATAIGVEFEPTALHSALGDARLCKAIRDKLLGSILDAER